MRFITLALLLFAFACNGGGDKPKTDDKAAPAKKVFNYLRTSAHKSLDPVKQFDAASAELISNVYDTLLEYHYLKRPYELVPNLLTKLPELGADGLTYTFELRSDVRFIDDPCFPGGKGRALKTDDVIYSLKRFAHGTLNVKSYVLMQGSVVGMDEYRAETLKGGDFNKLEIAGIKKIDDTHFTITLTKKNPLALMPLAATQTAIVPREAVEHYKDDFERQTVGTGPFKLKDLQRRGVTILERNPNYHLTYPTEGEPEDEAKGLLAAKGQKLPFVDEVHLPLIEEPQPAMLKFLSGGMDWIGIDRDNFVKMAVKDDKGFHLQPEYAGKFELYDEPRLSTEYWVFNMKDPLIGKNKALRKAIAYALDSAAFVAKMRNGRGVAVSTIVPPPIAGSERDVKVEWYRNDLAQAKKLLAEAGFPEGKGLPELTVEIRSSTTQSRQDFEFNRAELAKAGIILKASFQTFSAYLQRVESGNFQIAISGWQADYPDAENFYQLLYGPNKVPGPNSSSWANAEYDKLFEQARFMDNGPERFALFAKMHELIREDVPVIFVWSDIAVGLHQKWVKGFKRNMMIDVPFKYFDVDTKLRDQGVPGAK
jgi:oligopeptide transport system substrate-binding protein